jgi:hypothetical protein
MLNDVLREREMKRLHEYLEENKAIIYINSVEECIETFSRSGNLSSTFGYFRGHSNSDYALVSTLDRFGNDEYGQNEKLLIRQFKKSALNFLKSNQLPTTAFEWLALMQHYGVPTRLLDLTTSPYIALYFAVCDFENKNDAAVWRINPSLLHEGSIIKLQSTDFPYKLSMHGFHQPELLSEEYFVETFLSGKYEVCFILEPEKAEQRLYQQQGAFLVSSGRGVTTDNILAEVMFELIDKKSYKYGGGKEKGFWDWNIVKVIIPSKIKKQLFLQLLDMNINSSTLFPDLSGAAKYVTEFVKCSEYIGNRWNLLKIT